MVDGDGDGPLCSWADGLLYLRRRECVRDLAIFASCLEITVESGQLRAGGSFSKLWGGGVDICSLNEELHTTVYGGENTPTG